MYTRFSLILTLCMLFFMPFFMHAQEKAHLYDPAVDGMQQLDSAVTKAHAEGKYVLLQIGGNWCPWCIKLDKLMKADTDIRQCLSQYYVVIHLNYSKENRNEKILERLKHPERFGFPVLVVVDGEGNVLHIQDSGLLESGEAHDKDKVLRFLRMWTPLAVGGKKS